MTVVGIVPAGGSGERLGAERPKAFVVCAGRPLLEWSVEVLSAVCDR
ncbi:MAG TPA: 2-C-methyl-D-erythritol 4-phosphate cytidylyltransferase, partial [Solirubrobacterales bacterium]